MHINNRNQIVEKKNQKHAKTRELQPLKKRRRKSEEKRE
jgi:hypothetical protein